MLISADASVLLLIDIQERLAPAIANREACVARARLLLEAAGRLDVPVFASEQYPKGLGRLLPEFRNAVPENRIIAKTEFSCAACPELVIALRRLGRGRVLLCGMEAHVCVLQSALGLRAQGFAPAVVADAVGSRAPEDRELALRRLAHHGVEVVSSEMVVFEWLGRAGTAEFKAIAPLLK